MSIKLTPPFTDTRLLRSVTVGDQVTFLTDVPDAGITQSEKGIVEKDPAGVRKVRIASSEDLISVPPNTFVAVQEGTEAKQKRSQIYRRVGRATVSTARGTSNASRGAVKAGQKTFEVGQETYRVGKKFFDPRGAMSFFGISIEPPSSEGDEESPRLGKRDREDFLDIWYETSPKNFNKYHSLHGGDGYEMMRFLRRENPDLFKQIRRKWVA